MAATGFQKWIIVLTVVSAAVMELIDTSIVNVGLTQMSGNLGVTIEDIAWVITSYAIANVIIIPMTGFLQQYFGRKNYFMFSIALFTIASYCCGVASDLNTLVAFRFLQGIGGGALLSVSQGILFDTFTIKERPIASALFGMGVVLGPTFGPTLGGIIIDNYHWSWMFYINVPIGILALIFSYLFLEKQAYEFTIDRSKIQIDQLGILLLAVGIGSLQYVLERGETKDWFDDNSIIVLTIIAVVSLATFIWWELSIENPVVNLRVFKNRNLALGTILIVIIGFGLFTSVFLYPLFVQRIIGFTAKQTGLLLIPGAGITLFVFPLVGRLLASGKVSPRFIVMAGYGFFAAFCFIMSGYNAEASASLFVFALILRGLGLALTNIPLINSSVSTLKPNELPMGIAVTNMMRQIGGALGIAITNTYIQQRTAVHRGDLVSNLVANDPLTNDRINGMTQSLIAKGINSFDASTIAWQNMNAIINKQAMMISYLDSFKLAGVFFIVSFPLLFLIKGKKADAATLKAASEAH